MLRHPRLVFGCLAAAVLAWGLVGAPIHHQLTAHQHKDEPVLWKPRSLPLKSAKAKKARGHSHSHGQPGRPGQNHGAQSLEHGKALLHAAAPAPHVHLLLVELSRPPEPRHESPFRLAWHRTEQPQGP